MAPANRLRPGLVIADFVLAFMWAWAGALVKLLVYSVLRLGGKPEADLVKVGLSLLYMFFFAWLEGPTRGGSYNPLTAVASAVLAGGGYLFTAFGRIPAQVAGSIVGVKLVRQVFPQVGLGARLNVGIHHGALAEGVTTFMVVLVSMMFKTKDPKSFYGKTWFSSVLKLSLNILSSDLTGGIMNPASAFGWAFARGDHITLEHLLVYWIAPIQATLLGVWTVSLLTKLSKKDDRGTVEQHSKSE